MTWLSRLLPQSPRLPRLADQNRRTRQAQRRRRMATLETLEGRTLLSNVTTSFNAATSALTITGDTSNDNFTIVENLGGTVTVKGAPTSVVPGVGVVPPSTINGSSAAFTTSHAVTSITVNLPGTTNFDFVTLSGQGKTTPTTVKNVTVTATGANLTFTAGTTATNGVDDSGNLVVSDKFTSPVNAVLHATVNNSSFATLSIIQTGGGPDSSAVTLGNDSIPSSVAVSLGNANGDAITLNSGNSFGMTTLLQGNGGPSNSLSLGNSDTVSVGSGSYKSLNVDQLLNGTKNTITIGPGILISPINSTLPVVVDGVTIVPNGVSTSQGNGAGDVTTIAGVTTSTPAPPLNLPLPPNIGFSNITVVQGNGSVGLVPNTVGVNDSASVTTSSVPGNISITQSDLASNTPSWNTATISADTAGGSISISQGNAGGTQLTNGTTTPGDQASVTGSKAGSNITIGQGTGSKDSATVSTSTAGGNVSITQADVAANPAGDTALVMTDTIGGNVTISQGSASGDTATIDPTTVGGNVSITQLNGNNDTATVNVATVGGNVSITQGSGNSDTATVNVATVGGNVSITQGSGNSDTATVENATVGGNITITQLSGNGDTALIFDVTDTHPATTVPFITISISQGSGSGDKATVSGVIALGGNVTITQTDVAGNPAGDTALVMTDTIGGNVTISQGSASGDTATIDPTTVGGNVSITQLNGNGDAANVESATVGGSIGVSITQGSGSGDTATVFDVTALNGNITISQSDVNTNLAGDTASVIGVTAGTHTGSPSTDVAGNVTITQGSGPGDVAYLNLDNINNVTITQGDNVQGAFNGSTVASDVAEINDTSVTSYLTIIQGTGTSTDPTAGNYVAAIGYDYLGYVGRLPVFGTAGSSSVTAVYTEIDQQYANNQVFLGDPGPPTDTGPASAFTTFSLDVFTGNGGGAYVQAANTTVFYGPLGFFSPLYTIEGGGSGNTYVDGGGNSGVTVDPTTFNS